MGRCPVQPRVHAVCERRRVGYRRRPIWRVRAACWHVYARPLREAARPVRQLHRWQMAMRLTGRRARPLGVR